MCKRTTLWSAALLVGTLLFIMDRTEGLVFRIEPSQKSCSSKLALQIGKWAFSDNNLGYSMRYAVTGDSVQKQHRSTSACILQEVIYATEGLGGLVGAFSRGYCIGFCISGMVMYGLYSIPEREGQGWYFTDLFISRPLTAIGAATGTSFVGICLNQKGSFTGALIGSALGVAAGTLLQFWYDPSFWYLHYPCASIGAVLGYNYERFFLGKR
jgi:hypothetical protein